MASLEAAERAHYGRLDAAYQRQLDDYAEQSAYLDRCETLADLERYGFEPTLLENQRGFDRYQINMGLDPDDKVWICGDCGWIVSDIDDGCESCGFGQKETYI